MQTGTVTVGTGGDLERRQAVFRRWAPYFLLGLASFLGLATAGLIMPMTSQRVAAFVLVATALVF